MFARLMSTVIAFVVLLPLAASAQSAYYDDAPRIPGGYGFAGDGAAYLLADVGDDTRITRVTPQGTLAWRTTFAGNTVHSGEIRANSDRVCAAATQGESLSAPLLVAVVSCFDADSGALLYNYDLQATVTDVRPQLGLASDGTVTALFGDDPWLRRVVIAPNGTALSNALVETAVEIPDEYNYFAADGGTVVYGYTPDSRLVKRMAADGSIDTLVDACCTTIADGQIAPDGSVVVFLRDFLAEFIVMKFAADGTEVWRRELRETAQVVYPTVFDDDTVYFALATYSPGGTGVAAVPPFSYVALDLATGATRFDVAVPESRQAFFTGDIADRPDAPLVNVMSLFSNKYRVQLRDQSTGAIVRDTEIECGRSNCSKLLVHVTDDGTVRIIGRDNLASRAFVLSLVNYANVSTAFSRPTQRGIRGAYTVNTNGQGIVFDYDTATRTIFGAWFTTSHQEPLVDSNSTTDLHWYTVQAQYDRDDARELPMTIYDSTGGNFAAGQVIAPQAVGTASLSFFACGIGAMTYDFDDGHNDGAAGIVGLQRLTPLTDTCDRFGGSGQVVSEPEVPESDAAGFHRDFSGTWSQLGASGQGALIVVHPGSNVSGAWFTYDPSGVTDDAQRHHWFTLQGSLVGATNRTTTLTIYESIGGSLDFLPARSTYAVGTATLAFQSCDRATLAYTFNANAGNFALRQGTATLEHLGGCPVP